MSQKLIRLFEDNLDSLEENIQRYLNDCNTKLISITYASPTTFCSDMTTLNGWYAFLIINN